MYVEDPGPFADGTVPQWVTDWLGRRRKPSGRATQNKSGDKNSTKAGKNLTAARSAESEKKPDPKTQARRKAAAVKRGRATRESISGGLEELQQWLDDQIRGGLATFLNDPTSRCRTISARLVDAKAQAMAGRLDELPAKILQMPSEARFDALLQELGRIVLICRAWKANQSDAELTRLVGNSETRESVLELEDAPRVASTWEVVGEQVTTRRDGLVSHATWLLNLKQGHEFALLLDFFPASLGRRDSTFVIGEQFHAEVVYYPARQPLRAVIAERKAAEDGEKAWPSTTSEPLQIYRETLQQAPWISHWPLLLPRGRIAHSGADFWWQASATSVALPIANGPAEHIAGLPMHQAIALWDGMMLTLLSAQTEWGRIPYDG